MDGKIQIEQVANGYVVSTPGILGKTKVFVTLEEVLNELLFFFEGRSDNFYLTSYGKVGITRGDLQWPPIPTEKETTEA